MHSIHLCSQNTPSFTHYSAFIFRIQYRPDNTFSQSSKDLVKIIKYYQDINNKT